MSVEYLIKGAVKVGNGYDISSAILFSDDGTEKQLVNGFHYVTANGWRSSKVCVVNFPVIGVEDNLLVISEETAQMLISSYSGGKQWFSEQNRAESRNAGAWAYIMNNYVTDPHCTK